MTQRTALALCCAGLLSVPAFAGNDESKVPECCRKPRSTASDKATTGKMRCTLTGKEVDKCCCEKRAEGKLYCPLAKKAIEKCCCEEVKAKDTAA